MIRPDALNARAAATADNLIRLHAVREGARNNVLFAMLLRHARGCDDIKGLCDAARTINADFDPPLGDTEVLKTVLSAWKYEEGGRNWAGKEPRVYTLKSEWERLVAHPNGGEALFLCQHLRFCHWAHDTFAISPKAMAGAESIPGWTDPRKYRRARDVLIEMGILKRVHEGGHGAHTPSLFRFVDRTADWGHRMPPI
jgi:Primase C terminal 1 (PriCT-1)